MENSIYNFVFMRHGRSLADDEKKCEGRYDSPLTQVGISQAEQTAKSLKDEFGEFDKIISSPLVRAHKTAEIVNKIFQTKLETNELLMEKDNGVLAGMIREEANRKYPIPEFSHPFCNCPENSGESVNQLHARALLALNSIIDNNPGSYLIVSHGGILNAMLRGALGMSVPVNNSGVFWRFGDNTWANLKYDKATHCWIIVKFK